MPEWDCEFCHGEGTTVQPCCEEHFLENEFGHVHIVQPGDKIINTDKHTMWICKCENTYANDWDIEECFMCGMKKP